MSFIQAYPPLYHPPQLFNQETLLSLSRQRIIQKNLVHLQGFPDSLYDENLLISTEYLGQYGTIEKIMLVSKEDKSTHKMINSAYITFETNEQAAYCILSLDSFKIDDHIVRAFFGTTKYCNHFLNNFNCFNEEKCLYLHHLADPLDIIDENRKFGYNDHIKLAKKIISFGTFQNTHFSSNNNILNQKTIFPNITIYKKENENEINKTNSHKRKFSNLSNSSTANNSSNRINNRNLSESSSKEKDMKEEDHSKDIIKLKNDCNFECFQSGKKSRFFNNIDNEYKDDDNTSKLKNLSYIVNNLCKRISFFIYFKDKYHLKLLKEMENNYCLKLYNKTNDNEIKLILENKF